jgi:hypothetical protein
MSFRRNPPSWGERQRRTHHQDQVGSTSEYRSQHRHKAEDAKRRRSGKEIGSVRGGEGVNASDSTPRRFFSLDESASPFRFDGMTAIPRHCCHDMNAMPESSKFLNESGHDIACWRNVRGEVRANDRDVHLVAT